MYGGLLRPLTWKQNEPTLKEMDNNESKCVIYVFLFSCSAPLLCFFLNMDLFDWLKKKGSREVEYASKQYT